MAISRNLTLGTVGVGRAAGDDGGAAPPAPKRTAGRGGITAGLGAAAPVFTAPAVTVAAPPPGIAVGEPRPGVAVAPAPPIAAQPPAAAPAITPASPILGTVANIPPILGLPVQPRPPFRPPIDIGPIFPFPFPLPPQDKTTTQIAQGAMNQLRNATPAAVREAVSNIKNKNIAAGDLINFLERRTRVGEVLNELANDWSAQTKQDFAEAFQMPNTADKLPVMDAMVSISILNDPDLKNELQAENTTDASQADLLENRRIVWQWPEPGTPFTPPYLIVVAVEKSDTTQAQNIINSIIGDLVDFQGFKIPTAAANKLR